MHAYRQATGVVLIGATSTNNEDEVNALGTTFAVLNVAFATSFFYLFHVDTTRTEKERKVVLLV